MTHHVLSEYEAEINRIQSGLHKANTSKKRRSDLYAEARQLTLAKLNQENPKSPIKRALNKIFNR